jgi:hypothetical protein
MSDNNTSPSAMNPNIRGVSYAADGLQDHDQLIGPHGQYYPGNTHHVANHINNVRLHDVDQVSSRPVVVHHAMQVPEQVEPQIPQDINDLTVPMDI